LTAWSAGEPILERKVHFDELTEGPYRIYAGALEARQGDGYIAAVVVSRIEGATQIGGEVFRDKSLACGHRRKSPDEALRYAATQAREVIASQPQRLRC
jgi:hypothetical protein